MIALISLRPFFVSFFLLISGLSSSDTEVKQDATGFIHAVPCAANDKPHSFMDNFMDMLLTPEKIIEFSEYSDIDMTHLTADDIRKLESPEDDAECYFFNIGQTRMPIEQVPVHIDITSLAITIFTWVHHLIRRQSPM